MNVFNCNVWKDSKQQIICYEKKNWKQQLIVKTTESAWNCNSGW